MLSGVFVGALYGLLGLGLEPELGPAAADQPGALRVRVPGRLPVLPARDRWGIDPLLTLLVIVPLFFALGAALHWLMARFQVTPFNSLLLTFGLTGIVEALIQSIWTADFRKLESRYATQKLQGRRAVRAGARADHAGAGGRAVASAVWAVLRYTDLGRRCAPPPRTRRSPPRSASTSSALALLLAGTCVGARRRRRRLPRAQLHAGAVADLRLDRRRLRRRDAGRPGPRWGRWSPAR